MERIGVSFIIALLLLTGCQQLEELPGVASPTPDAAAPDEAVVAEGSAALPPPPVELGEAAAESNVFDFQWVVGPQSDASLETTAVTAFTFDIVDEAPALCYLYSPPLALLVDRPLEGIEALNALRFELDGEPVFGGRIFPAESEAIVEQDAGGAFIRWQPAGAPFRVCHTLPQNAHSADMALRIERADGVVLESLSARYQLDPR